MAHEPNAFMVLEGPHGCGKSTVLKHLEKRGWITITMSTVLREYARTMEEVDPAICRYINDCVAKRIYVNSETCNTVFTHYMNEHHPAKTTFNKKFVLDGYPRKRKQVDHLFHILLWDRSGYHSERRVSSLFFEIYPWVAMARQWERGLKTARADDLTPEFIANGFELYRKYSPEVRKLLLEHTTLHSINANESMENVAAQVEHVIDQEEKRLIEVSTEAMIA